MNLKGREIQEMDWTLLSGPLTGALIGYLTNYLAVKMLFRPRKAIYIFKKRLPFTPGVITRGKDRLAKAVSRLVSETLITEEDIRGYLLSAEMENSVAEKAEEILSEKLRDEIIEKSAIKSSEYEKKREDLCLFASRAIYEAVREMPVKERITETAYREISKKLDEIKSDGMRGKVAAMMLPEEKIMAMVRSAAERFQENLDARGMDYIEPIVSEKAEQLENMTGYDIFSKAGMDREEAGEFIKNIYRNSVEKNAAKMMRHIDISDLVEEKVRSMEMAELEDMVMSMMKKELNSVVRLGIDIRIVIGFINVFI